MLKNEISPKKARAASKPERNEGPVQLGNYILGKHIGEGTFGKVYLGLHVPTREKVAVKIIEKARILPERVDMVKTEIKVLGMLRHSNLLTLYEMLETPRSLLLVTEFLPGGELMRHVLKNRPLGYTEVGTIFKQLFSAVSYLHKMGIAHRDLKPENVLFDFDGRLKVIDFGLSKIYTKGSKLLTCCGSPCYVPPQMIKGEAYEPQKADVWSLGVVLYILSHSCLPFIDDSVPKIYKRILIGKFSLRNDLPQNLRNVIVRMLTVNSNDRISLCQLAKEEWINEIQSTNCYGLNLSERLHVDPDILRQMSQNGCDIKTIASFLEKNQRNSDTGHYFILMKKMVKEGRSVPSYLNDSFDSSWVETVSFEDDSTQGEEGIEAPTFKPESMPDSGPLAANSWDWWTQDNLQNVKTVAQAKKVHLNMGLKRDLQNQTNNLSDIVRRRLELFYGFLPQAGKKQLCLKKYSQESIEGKKSSKMPDYSSKNSSTLRNIRKIYGTGLKVNSMGKDRLHSRVTRIKNPLHSSVDKKPNSPVLLKVKLIRSLPIA